MSKLNQIAAKREVNKTLRKYSRKPFYRRVIVGREDGVVDVPGWDNMIYVREEEHSPAFAVYNFVGQFTSGVHVLVGEQQHSPGLTQVLGTILRAGLNWPSGSRLPKHANTHYIDGGDPVYITDGQITPLLAYVSEDAAMTIIVNPGYIVFSGTVAIIQSTTVDVTSSIPVTGARYSLLVSDDEGVITVVDGTPVASLADLVITDAPAITSDQFPLALVRLYEGQTVLSTLLTSPDVIPLIWGKYGGGAGSLSLDDLIDVDTSGADDGDVLTYDSFLGLWAPNGLPPANLGTRTVIVDVTGQGDYASIKDACDYVETQTPAEITPWLVLVLPGVYAEEPYVIPSYTTVAALTVSRYKATVIVEPDSWTAGTFTELGALSKIIGIGIDHELLTGVTGDMACFKRTTGTGGNNSLISILDCTVNVIIDSDTYRVSGVELIPEEGSYEEIYFDSYTTVINQGSGGSYGVYNDSSATDCCATFAIFGGELYSGGDTIHLIGFMAAFFMYGGVLGSFFGYDINNTDDAPTVQYLNGSFDTSNINGYFSYAQGPHDYTAFHSDQVGEFLYLDEKTAPIAGDLILLEDSEDGFAKKYLDVANIPGGGDMEWDILTNGDIAAPELIFANANVIWVPVEGA